MVFGAAFVFTAVLSNVNPCTAFTFKDIPAFRFMCKAQSGSTAQFQFDPLQLNPVGIKLDNGPINRLSLDHYTAHPDFDFHQKDEYGYDVPVKNRPIIVQLMDAGPYGIIYSEHYDTGWVFTVERDGRPSGTGSGRDFYNCRRADKLDFQ